jgi:Zn-dependent peptidase ImmA (M78 family)
MQNGGRANRHTDKLFGGDQPTSASGIKPHHEVQANRLAAQILMPAARVRERFGAGMSVEQLANHFGVSRAAMEIRLKNLGLVQ